MKTIDVEHIPAFSVDEKGAVKMAAEGPNGERYAITIKAPAVSTLLEAIHVTRTTEQDHIEAEFMRPARPQGAGAFYLKANGEKGLTFWLGYRLGLPVLVPDSAIPGLRKLLDTLEAMGKG